MAEMYCMPYSFSFLSAPKLLLSIQEKCQNITSTTHENTLKFMGKSGARFTKHLKPKIVVSPIQFVELLVTLDCLETELFVTPTVHRTQLFDLSLG